jgi:hypothetical protein
MKYEAVFGNQELFDGAGTFTGLDVVVHSIASGIKSYARLSDLTPESLRNHPVCAMRRIIAEPNRWTVEDQKAGRMPEVGCLVDTFTGECVVIGRDSNLKHVAVQHHDDGYMDILHISKINPIETPEDKAQREEDEFVNELMKDSQVIYTSSEQLAMCRKTARAAYRKLSGALSVPAKGGE